MYKIDEHMLSSSNSKIFLTYDEVIAYAECKHSLPSVCTQLMRTSAEL